MLPFLGRSWIIKACLVLNIATFMDLLGRALFHRAKYLSIKSQRRTCLLQKKHISKLIHIVCSTQRFHSVNKTTPVKPFFCPIPNCLCHWYKIYCIYFLMYKSLVLGKQQRLIQPSKNPSSFHRLLGNHPPAIKRCEASDISQLLRGSTTNVLTWHELRDWRFYMKDARPSRDIPVRWVCLKVWNQLLYTVCVALILMSIILQIQIKNHLDHLRMALVRSHVHLCMRLQND